MESLITNVASDLGNDDYEFGWEKKPDEYDQTNDVVWEGNWEIVQKKGKWDADTDLKSLKKTSVEILKCNLKCKWNCPNGHMGDHFCYENEGGYDKWLKKYKEELIKSEREAIERTLNPDYHVCTHTTHSVCTESLCCDFFWHEGDCDFVSNDGECGFAVRYGDQ
jgi:hypothetical protein